LTVEDLGPEVAELLSLSGVGEARSLNKLAELAVRQVPGCSGAHATVWRDRELVSAAATHPDTADLTDLQLKLGSGPLITAAYDGVPVSCPDTLTEDRWPQWAEEALRRGVRCSAHLVRRLPPMTLVLSLFGVRPASLDAESAPIARTLTAFGGAMLANTMAFGEARRTATQLRDSVAARAITDQAKGVLMHALGCGAEAALAHLRRESQRRHVKVTQVAAEVIAAYDGADGRVLPPG